MPTRADLDSDGYARRHDFWPRREGEAQEEENEGPQDERAAAIAARAAEAQQGRR
jgi:hypothetical protein